MRTAIDMMLDWLLRTTWHVVVLIALVLLIQWLFRSKLTPAWRHALWLLVVVRLVSPVIPESRFSLFNQAGIGTAVPALLSGRTHVESAAPVVDPGAVEPEPDFERESASAQVPEVFPGAAESRNAEPRRESTAVQPHSGFDAEEVISLKSISLAIEPLERASPAWSWKRVLLSVWIAGALLLGLRLASGTWRFSRRLRRARRLTDARVLGVLDDCRALTGVRKPLDLIETNQVDTPALFGLFRLKLLLPAGMTRRFSDGELRHVFLHELAHIRRWDMPTNWLLALLQVVHWFNPAVWFAFHRMRADRELACDALALACVGEEEASQYGKTIVRLLEDFARPSSPPLPGLVGILEDKRQLRQRLRMIVRFKKPSRWSVLSILLVALLGIVALTDAQTRREEAAADKIGTQDEDVPNEVMEEKWAEWTADWRELRVTVLDAETLKPVSGVTLSSATAASKLRKANLPERPVLTDAEGAGILKIPEVDDHRSPFELLAHHPDYAPCAVAWHGVSGKPQDVIPEKYTIQLERGVPIGGVVRDERGNAIKDVAVLISASNFRWALPRPTHQEYSRVPGGFGRTSAVAFTDGKGRWNVRHFPSDLENAGIHLERADGSRARFDTGPPMPFTRSSPVSMDDLREGSAVFVLEDGLSVRGSVTDEKGHPIRGAKVREGDLSPGAVHEVLTGDGGAFVFHNRRASERILTASAKGFATRSEVVRVEPGMQAVRLQLSPADPLQVRVINDADKPIAGARLRIAHAQMREQLIDWQGKTGPDGSCTWNEAPESPLALIVSADGFTDRQIKIPARQRHGVAVLKEGTHEKVLVRGTVTEGGTGTAVNGFSVFIQTESGTRGSWKGRGRGSDGRFEIVVNRNDFGSTIHPAYRLRIEADGFQTGKTEKLEFYEGDQELQIALQSGGSVKGVVLLPAGTPAIGAKVYWPREANMGPRLVSNRPGEFTVSDKVSWELARVSGEFSIPALEEDVPVVITHLQGCAETTVEQLRHTPEVRLRSWGRVEGTLLVGGVPKAGQRVMIKTLHWHPRQSYHAGYNATTDKHGRFVFEKLFPNEYVLYQFELRDQQNRRTVQSHPMPIVVEAGKTNSVIYPESGRAVIGKVGVLAEQMQLDWGNDTHVLALKQPEIEPPYREDYVDMDAFGEAWADFNVSEAKKAHNRQARSYQLFFEKDGSFRADDVPAGTYELRIRVTKPGKFTRDSYGEEETVASLTHEVIVPGEPNAEPVDVGVVPLQVRKSALQERGEPKLPHSKPWRDVRRGIE